MFESPGLGVDKNPLLAIAPRHASNGYSQGRIAYTAPPYLYPTFRAVVCVGYREAEDRFGIQVQPLAIKHVDYWYRNVLRLMPEERHHHGGST